MAQDLYEGRYAAVEGPTRAHTHTQLCDILADLEKHIGNAESVCNCEQSRIALALTKHAFGAWGAPR